MNQDEQAIRNWFDDWMKATTEDGQKNQLTCSTTLGSNRWYTLAATIP